MADLIVSPRGGEGTILMVRRGAAGEYHLRVMPRLREPLDTLLGRADAALYQAKKNGRDRTVFLP